MIRSSKRFTAAATAACGRPLPQSRQALLGQAKRRLGKVLNSSATAGEGTQNLLCAYLAAAVLVGLLANTLFGLWWLDPTVGLLVACLAIREGREAWRGEECGC